MDTGGRSRAAFGPQDDEAANDEGAGHHHGGEQMGLDGLAKQQPQQHRRHKGNQHIQRKTLCLLLRGQRRQRGTDLLPIHQDDGKDGARLDGNIEHLGLGIVKTQERARKNQVTGGGDGQKLGQPLHHTHDGGLDQQNNVHARAPFDQIKRGLSVASPPCYPVPRGHRRHSRC